MGARASCSSPGGSPRETNKEESDSAPNMTKLFHNSLIHIIIHMLIHTEQPPLPKRPASCGSPRASPLHQTSLNTTLKTLSGTSYISPGPKGTAERGNEKKLTNQQQSSGHLGSLSSPHLLSPSEKPVFVSWRNRTSFARAQVL